MSLLKKWINLNAKSLARIRYYDFTKKMHLFTNAAAYLDEDDIEKKSSCFSFLFICTSKAQRNIKFAFFYGIRFIANRDMICMRQHQLALPSKMHVHKFHVSLFFMQIPLWKFHYIQPDMCIWFPSWSTIFPFFLISFHFFRCCLSHD